MTPQSPVTQTLYAQLQEEAAVFNAAIFEQGIAGSPYLNHANGYAYWYWQVAGPDGKLKRLSLGRDTPETRVLVEGLKERKAEASEAIAALRATTRAFVASGGMNMESAHFRVMEHLAQAGLFRKSLVLVGSHAFTALGNLLGLRWGSQLKTSDMDFARALGISLALPGNAEPIDVLATAQEFDPTFFAVPQLDHRQPSTAIISRKTRIKLDFLTVHAAKESDQPRYFPDLAIAATPLRYMDYLLGGLNRRGLVIGSYAFPINLPDPARFAIHKLVIAQLRHGEGDAKRQKDIRQGDELLAGMIEIGLAHEAEEALAALPAAGYPNALELIRRSAGQAQLSGDWLRQQLDKPAL
jgi:hypothetical protein